MKIGILTHPLVQNFGGIIQNWALQQVLGDMGHTPVTLNHDIYYSRLTWLMGRVKEWTRFQFKPKYPFPHGGIIHPIPQIEKFVKKNINTVHLDKPFKTRDIQNVNLDAIIVGSDQVWRPCYVDNIYDMFLRFAEGMNIRRVSYAASFGTDSWEFDPIQTKECMRLLSKFNSVSVREQSGLKLCKEHLGCDAIYAIDPTLLLKSYRYDTLLSEEQKKPKDTLFCYILDIGDETRSKMTRLADTLGLQLEMMSTQNNLTEDDSIEKWIASIRNAKYVITDSFHGTVFSIIYRKKFITSVNKERGASRFGILEQLGLGMRASNKLSNDILESEIDWVNVKNRIEEYRKQSLLFLENALNK